MLVAIISAFGGECVIIHFSPADDADFLLFLYPTGYNLSALSADEKLNGGCVKMRSLSF